MTASFSGLSRSTVLAPRLVYYIRHLPLCKDNSFAGAVFSAIPVRTVRSHLGIEVFVSSRGMKVDSVTPQSFFKYSQLAMGCLCRLQAVKNNVLLSPKQLDE